MHTRTHYCHYNPYSNSSCAISCFPGYHKIEWCRSSSSLRSCICSRIHFYSINYSCHLTASMPNLHNQINLLNLWQCGFSFFSLFNLFSWISINFFIRYLRYCLNCMDFRFWSLAAQYLIIYCYLYLDGYSGFMPICLILQLKSFHRLFM